MNHKLQETRYAAFVLVWTEANLAQPLAKRVSTISVGPSRGHDEYDEIVAIVRWAAPVTGPGRDSPDVIVGVSATDRDSPDVIVGVSATDKEAIKVLVDEIRRLPGVRNPQDPQVVHLGPRYEEGWERPHNGWP